MSGMAKKTPPHMHYVLAIQEFIDDNNLDPDKDKLNFNKVAKLCGVSVVALYRIRDGLTTPGLNTITKLRNGIGLTLDYVKWVEE
jgi:hypothetical protein